MNILILGSGGREHAFAWKIHQSPSCDQLFVAPGNAGTSHVATNVALNVNDFDAIEAFVEERNIDLVVVGPEEPLVRGIRDHFNAKGLLDRLKFIGPDQHGAQLEGSKDFAKNFMQQHGIPTAKSLTVTKDTLEEGTAFLDTLQAPYVLKADGLAAGKGVLIIPDLQAAKTSLEEMLNGQFGDASSRVVIEEFLDGIELSIFVLTDGQDYKILPEAKDYKRIGEGDTGPNTGGMGAISPVPFADETFLSKVRNEIIQPTIDGLQADGIEYKGFIFIGLMNVAGQPYVIEYNVRMGDPETEAVFPRVQSDLVRLLAATSDGTLGAEELQITTQHAATVVAVSQGYPGKYEKGKLIQGLDKSSESIVFHAGTREENGTLTNGGRVLAITGMGESRTEALKCAYNTLEGIQWDGITFRSDIGRDLEQYT